MMKTMRTLLNVGSVIILMLMMMLKKIIAISLKNIEILHTEIVISMLNHNPTVFHSLKNHHSHHIKQELGKFNFKINVIQ